MATISLRDEPILLPLLLLIAVIWLLPHTPLPSRFHTKISHYSSALPAVKIDLHPHRTLLSRYPSNKTALYLEPRASVTHLTPLLVHMMQVVPPEWRFLFIGSSATIDIARRSGTVRAYEAWGKLRIGKLDRWASDWEEGLGIDEMNNRLMTNVTFYEEELPGVEHLFVFHSDAVLCANSEGDLNDWVGFDWVGAPWNNPSRFGGNGGLSLRRVSKILEVLRFQKPYRGEFNEDQWLAARIGLLPDANMADPELEKDFAVETIWSERPLGYHLNPGGLNGEVWDDRERRRQVFEYCPEIKIIMDMRLERERCQYPMFLPPIEELPKGAEFEGGGDSGGDGVLLGSPVEGNGDGMAVDHNGNPVPASYRPIQNSPLLNEGIHVPAMGAEIVPIDQPGVRFEPPPSAPDALTPEDFQHQETSPEAGNTAEDHLAVLDE